jgi:hypothetical protein
MLNNTGLILKKVAFMKFQPVHFFPFALFIQFCRESSDVIFIHFGHAFGNAGDFFNHEFIDGVHFIYIESSTEEAGGFSVVSQFFGESIIELVMCGFTFK